MKLNEQLNLVLGPFMVCIYLIGGIFVIYFAETVGNNPSLFKLMGGIMIAYSFIRLWRLVQVYKRWKQERTERTNYRKKL